MIQALSNEHFFSQFYAWHFITNITGLLNTRKYSWHPIGCDILSRSLCHQVCYVCTKNPEEIDNSYHLSKSRQVWCQLRNAQHKSPPKNRSAFAVMAWCKTNGRDKWWTLSTHAFCLAASPPRAKSRADEEDLLELPLQSCTVCWLYPETKCNEGVLDWWFNPNTK